MDKRPFIVAVDFDGTIVEINENFNSTVFKLLPNAKETINWMVSSGIYIIIWTCRQGIFLESAKNFLNKNGIKYHRTNSNIPTIDFKTSQKIFYDLIIDDKNIMCDGIIDWVQIKQKVSEILVDRSLNKITKRKCNDFSRK